MTRISVRLARLARPGAAGVALAAIPLIPDGDAARELAEKELAKPEYQAAKPTLVDQWARAVVDFLIGLFTPQRATDLGPWAAIVVGVILVAVLVVVLLIWGRPRRSQSRPSRPVLLGSADDRTAAELRAEAERAAREEDWTEAVVLRYRAIARSLIERDLIAPAPGATAQTIAREAAAPFPSERDALHDAAVAFDDVRYLGRAGTAELYQSLAQTDDRLRALRPVLPEAVPA